MSADLSTILTYHLEAQARHAARGASLAQDEANARERLEKILEARAQWQSESEALRLAGQVYRRMTGAPPSPEQMVHGSESSVESIGSEAGGEGALFGRAPLKARIGPQRYLILSEMRTHDMPLSVDDLALVTGFSPKRVKDQMKADSGVNVVSEANGRYILTTIGSDLLNRFEAYKAKRGEPLPSYADVLASGEQAEEVDEEGADDDIN